MLRKASISFDWNSPKIYLKSNLIIIQYGNYTKEIKIIEKFTSLWWQMETSTSNKLNFNNIQNLNGKCSKFSLKCKKWKHGKSALWNSRPNKSCGLLCIFIHPFYSINILYFLCFLMKFPFKKLKNKTNLWIMK